MQNKSNRRKVSNITQCSKKVKESIEEFTLTMSSIASMEMLLLSGFDLIIDGNLDIANNSPGVFFGTVLSPVVIAGLIKTLDKNSSVNEDIKDVINGLKPKTRVRK